MFSLGMIFFEVHILAKETFLLREKVTYINIYRFCYCFYSIYVIILYLFVPSARHGFINCVLVTTRLKCRKEETLFITRIADTLSNMRVYSPHCKSINVTLCSSAQPVLKNMISISFTLLQILSCLTLSIVWVHV